MMIRTLVYLLLAAVAVFAGVSYSLPAQHVFHVLNAVALSATTITIVAYSPAIADAWEQRASHIFPGHLLAFGIVISGTGLVLRLGRWFFTESVPDTGFDQWMYNVGLWGTVLASLFLIGAVALTEPKWSRTQVWAHSLAFVLMTVALWTFDYIWVGLPHFGPIPLR